MEVQKEGSCDQSHDSSDQENDQSHDSSDSENEIFLTPSTSPVPPQHDDRELVSHNICSQ